MLVIGLEAKNAFQQDSSHKELNIEILNNRIRDYNFYKGDISFASWPVQTFGQGAEWYISFNGSPVSSDITRYVNWDYIEYRKYVCIGYNMEFKEVASMPSQIQVICQYKDKSGTEHSISQNVNTSEITAEGGKYIYFIIDRVATNLDKVLYIKFKNTASTNIKCAITLSGMQVDLSDYESELPMWHKNGIGNTDISQDIITIDNITNKNIAFESFSMTESLCSQDNIKFGLCEAANCKFDVVGLNENFNNKAIKPSIRAMRDDDYIKVNWVNGLNPVEHHDTWNNANMASAHSKSGQFGFKYYEEKSKGYIPENWKTCVIRFDLKITELTMPSGTDAPYYLRIGIRGKNASGSYASYWNPNKYIKVSDLQNDYVTVLLTYNNIEEISQFHELIDGMAFAYYDANMHQYTTGTINKIVFSWANLQLHMVPNVLAEIPPFDEDDAYAYQGTLNNYYNGFMVVLGIYNITEVKTEHTLNKITKHITAYDNKLKLEQNAANWFKDYLYCPAWWFGDDDERPRHYMGWPKQIYGSFFNFAKNIGLEADKYAKELVVESTYNASDPVHQLSHFTEVHTKDYAFGSEYEMEFAHLQFGLNFYTQFDTSCCYQVVVEFPNEPIEDYYNNRLPLYKDNVDDLGRGVLDNSSILVEVVDSNDRVINQFSVNNGDYFVLNPDAANAYIYFPMNRRSSLAVKSQLMTNVKIYKVYGLHPNLANGWLPLRYFNEFDTNNSEWNNKAFACESTITGRDVVRSLLEPCGCFFGLSRYDINPIFIYCTKSGLYPSNTLYPANDLYPRGGVDGENVPLSRYMSLMFDDYSVKDFGRIQILKRNKSSDSKAVVQWEYVGSSAKTNTYLIEDNIFYCAEEMEYEFDSMWDISQMLENMYNQISNMGYTPNTTVALGMPWLEVGDRVGMLTESGGTESFIFRRTLTGIQMLTDTFESEGDEVNEAIKEYGYKLIN